MGLSYEAFYDVDQEEVDAFIREHNVDTKRIESVAILTKHFYEKYSGIKLPDDVNWWQIPTNYSYNSKRKLHVLYEYIACNSIRRHELLLDDGFPPRKTPLPYHIKFWDSIYRPEQAIETAKEFRQYFPEDEILMDFAEWLERTSKYCYAYKLSM